MKSTDVLCIIDVQSIPNSRDRAWFDFVNSVVMEVRKAKAAGAKIIVVDYELTNRSTDPKVYDEIGDYPFVGVVKKQYDGGGEIMAALDGDSYDDIFVCGCFTGCCVMQTVVGLRKALTPDRVVVSDACFDIPWSEELIPEVHLRRYVRV